MKRLYLSLFFLPLLLVMSCHEKKNIVLSKQDFQNPPQWAKPSTFMHVMSGNMSKVGMQKDIKSLADAGIGGILLYNIGIGIPNGHVKYNSEEHQDLVKYTAEQCELNGVSFGVHNCSGWSSSGGPWIKPEQSMKMLVYRQIVTDGGKVRVKLPQPTMRKNFYKDLVVLAYPALQSDIIDSEVKLRVRCSDPQFDIKVAMNNRIDDQTSLRKTGVKDPFVIFDYGKPNKISFAYVSTTNKRAKLDLYGSNNGVDYKLIKHLSEYRPFTNEWVFTNTFPSVTKRYYKLVSNSSINVKDIRLSASAVVNQYLCKNGLSNLEDGKLNKTEIVPSDMIIRKDQIIDLTSDLKEEGELNTTLPEGKWTIMRIGYTTTGVVNRPSSDSGRGLECDKLSSKALDIHFAAFTQKVIDHAKEVAPNALQYVLIDSYEMGGQNWTSGLTKLFKESKGYDLTPYLPLILGKYVDSVQSSEAVLSDFREVCCNLMNTNYYGHFSDLCHKNGVKSYIEPYGFGGPFDRLKSDGLSDIPMGEFWMLNGYRDLRSVVSGAHIYGKKIVAAESFTSSSSINWSGAPYMVKPSGDEAWKEGVNQFMLHRYVHQPNTKVRPGMTMSRWGFNFDRNQTWWMNGGKAMFTYMARGSYMLRLGVPVNDILEFNGEGHPNLVPKSKYPGFKYDAVNADVLKNRVIVNKGKMVLPEGTTYQCLVLKNCKQLTLETLKRISELAQKGVPITGELPTSLLGYKNLNTSKDQMNALVQTIRHCGNYYPEGKFADLIKKEGLKNDFKLSGCNRDFGYAHRHMVDGTDIYFISNPDSSRQTFQCEFRVKGKKPELWYPMDGQVIDADNFKMDEEQTTVSISLEPLESVFVVFRENTSQKTRVTTVDRKKVKQMSLNNDWVVSFSKDYNFDDTVLFDSLYDWSRSKNEQIKYYSGTAVYKHDISVDSHLLQSSNEVMLDLGQVCVVAEVYVNDIKVCVSWMPPFHMDISKYLKAGNNEIRIKLTNQWTNRLIGDEQYPKQDDGYLLNTELSRRTRKVKMPKWYLENEPIPAGPRTTFCTDQILKADSPLIPAGLIGPVTLTFSKVTVSR